MKKIRLSGIQLTGLFLIVAGLLLLMGSGACAIKQSRKSAQQRMTETEVSEEEDIPDSEPAPGQAAKKEISLTMPMVAFGGVMILAGIPCFYLPHAEGGKRRRKYEDEDDGEPEDEEFDYPDDDFDFILDDEIRDKLIAERAEKIRAKQKRLKKQLRKKKRL